MGHTLAACGSLELNAVLAMLHGNYIIPTLNLKVPDPDCGNIRHVTSCESRNLYIVLKNSFALGGSGKFA